MAPVNRLDTSCVPLLRSRYTPAGGAGLQEEKGRKRMNTRRVIWLMGLVLGSAALWEGAGPVERATAATKLTLGMPTTPPNLVHITPWVALEQGFFAEEGLDVQITTFEGGVYVIRNVVSGGLDAGAGVGGSGAVAVAKKGGGKGHSAPGPR